MKEKFFKLNIILVEPNGPLNVGNVARLCANFEVDELRIVSPQCDIFSAEAKKMALKGQIYIEKCKIFKTIYESIKDCDLVFATCGRIDNSPELFCESPDEISNWISNFNNINNLAVIFGREDRGLTNQELLFAQKVINIKTSYNYPSLNLSHAVSIILYELNKFSKNKAKKNAKVYELASSRQIYDSFSEIEELLIKIGYLFEHTSKARISKFKKYISKSQTSSDELNILRGIIHQMNWALENLRTK